VTKALVPVLAALAVIGTLAAPVAASHDVAVLVYSHTAEFRHSSIPAGLEAIAELGERGGFTVEATEDPGAFTPENLARFAAVIFLNTTGEVMAGDGARDAFEDYLRGGGGWVGVHSAADTEYDWPFYAELLGGAYFLTHPLQNQSGSLHVEAHDHPAVAHLPEPWVLPSEEYYSFTDNPRGRVRVLMTIDESSYDQVPNTAIFAATPFAGGEASPLETGVMGDHPMSWCLDVDEGRAFYTALGHEAALYGRPSYREHLLQGILTAAGVVDADCSSDAASSRGGQGGGDDAGADDGTDADGAVVDGDEVEPDAPQTSTPDGTAEVGRTATAGPQLPVTGGALPALSLGLLAAAAAVRRRAARVP
jgi:uncharacterized protein